MAVQSQEGGGVIYSSPGSGYPDRDISYPDRLNPPKNSSRLDGLKTIGSLVGIGVVWVVGLPICISYDVLRQSGQKAQQYIPRLASALRSKLPTKRT